MSKFEILIGDLFVWTALALLRCGSIYHPGQIEFRKATPEEGEEAA
jgi:hypothetical protein